MKKLRKDLRKHELKQRKNFLPALFITILSWIITAIIVYFVDPASAGALPVFFLMLSLSIMFTSSLILANSRRGFFVTIVLVGFLCMRYFGLGTPLNFILLAGSAIAFEFYLSKSA